MFRINAFLTGAAVFLAGHTVELIGWRTVFGPAGGHAAWFLNSGRAVAFMTACLFLASLAYTRWRASAREEWGLHAANLTAGAIAALTAVLASIGAGTIFPIAIVIGAIVSAAACTAGAAIGTKL